MLKIIGFILLFLFILCLVLFAQGEGIKFFSSVDKTEVSLTETLNFKITLEGDFKGSPKIVLPRLEEDFDVVSKAQSQQISLSAGEKSKTFVLSLMLLAKKEGRIRIGPAKLKAGLKTYATEPIEITIKPRIDKNYLKPEKRLPIDREAERITL